MVKNRTFTIKPVPVVKKKEDENMLKGKGVSEGIGIGRVLILKKEEIRIEKSKIENVSKELEKLNVSLNSVIEETKILKENSCNEQKQILEAI